MPPRRAKLRRTATAADGSAATRQERIQPMTAEPAAATLSRQRRFVTPAAGETLEALAARALPDLPPQEAADKIRQWNMHVFMLRQPPGLLLCSDVVFVEPPLA